MSYINFSSANCKNCYKCLRSCPVKAIRFKNEQAEIVEDRCISCGHCLAICPQNARQVVSDMGNVKEAISSGKKVIVSLAPSFAGVFNERTIVAALKNLGFSNVEETALGAHIVTEQYNAYIKNNNKDNYIITACPSVNFLLEKYFPSLIKYMLPVVSPMVAHGKVLKQFYGGDSFVVFIGPCVAKKIETYVYSGERVIDAVLTYDEILAWFEDLNIDIDKFEELEFDRNALERKPNFPLNGGIIEAMGEELNKIPVEVISVSGTDECIELFKSIENGDIKGVLIEANSCKGSCIGGPSMIKNTPGYYKRLQKVKNYIKDNSSSDNLKEVTNGNSFNMNSCKSLSISMEQSIIPKNVDEFTQSGQDKKIKEMDDKTKEDNNIDFSLTFTDKSIAKKSAKEDEIQSIMRQMGKYNDEDELNCGVCGYNTCKEKAQAVFEGMSETNMCLHHMRNKAESLTNVIFENSPNCIILLDGDMKVREINPAAEEVFMIKAENIKNKPISIIIGDEDFRYVKETENSIMSKKVAYPQYNVVFIENVVYLPKQDIVMVSMMNIMESEKNKRELLKLKENTLNAAQEVIEKQMRVAQEIASLLGETTAETKVILTKLKRVVEGEGE